MENYCDKKALLQGEAVDVTSQEVSWKVDLFSGLFYPVFHADMTLQTLSYDIHFLLI